MKYDDVDTAIELKNIRDNLRHLMLTNKNYIRVSLDLDGGEIFYIHGQECSESYKTFERKSPGRHNARLYNPELKKKIEEACLEVLEKELAKVDNKMNNL